LPDGAKFIFDCEVDSGNRDICSINADGTGLARLTTDAAEDVGAAWAPAGSRMAFSTSRFSGTHEVAMMNPDGTSISRVGAAGTPGAGPRWSPDGNRIVYVDNVVDPYGWS